MADVITTLHPEGITTDNLYPNIKKENLPTQLQPVADFALSEYEKTLNIWDEVWELGAISGAGVPFSSDSLIRSKNFNPCLPQTTYYIKSPKFLRFCWYDENKTFISVIEPSNSAHTSPANAKFFKFCTIQSSYGTIYNHDITISEGDHSVGYQPYNGKVMHVIDCQGVLLWENGDPSSVFANQSITVLNINDYSYLEIEYKYNKDLRVSQVMKVSTSLTAGTDSEFIISCSNQDQASNVASRSFIIQNDTTIYVGSGGFNGNVNQAYIIPVAIYGIK